jgi:MoxR-like ATPase
MAEHLPTLSNDQAFQLVKDLQTKLAESIFGQEAFLEEAFATLLSGGHILITGAPGLAKTTLVRVLARQLGLSFGRVQFTPDLLPSDIIGSEILNIEPESGRRHFEFSKGPVFTQLLLADEINRASPRTQSALLEAMQERSVTVGGKTHMLTPPFMVFATQNPFESEGTFPLPEAQLDRFLMHSLVDYPSDEAEARILSEHAENRLVGEQAFTNEKDQKKMDAETISALMARAKMVHVDPEMMLAVKELVRSTRPGDETCPAALRPMIWYGAGPRAGISLISVCRSFALMSASERVRWSYIKRLGKAVLRHRIRLTAQAARDGLNPDMVIEQLFSRLEEKYRNLGEGVGA